MSRRRTEGLLASHLEEAGWSVEREHADGADALSAALQRRGWNAVLYGGDGRGAVPARKALALVRMADPHLPFLVVSPNIRRGDLSSVVRGVDDAAKVVSDPKQLSDALTKELEATRLRRRVGSAQHLLPRPAGDRRPPGGGPGAGGPLPARAGHPRRLAGLDPRRRVAARRRTARCCAARPSGTPPTRARTPSPSRATRASRPSPPARGCPAACGRSGGPPGCPTSRATRGCRAPPRRCAPGLSTAIAFPLAVGDECLGVIEFFTGGVHEHNGEVSAMFATVGGQLAQYLARHAAERDPHARVPRPRGAR